MRSGIALTRLLLKDLASRYTQQLNIKSPWLGRLIVFLPLLLLLPVFQLADMLYKLFESIGKPELSMTYMLVAVVPLLVLTAIPMMISLFFFSKDLGLLSSLPMTTRAILLAKSAVIYTYLLAMGLFILGPSLGIYTIVDAFKPLTLVVGLVAIFLVPIFPMAIAALLLMPLMRVIGKAKKRGLWLMVGNVVLLAIILGIQVFTVRLQVGQSDPLELLMAEDGLLTMIGQRFWPSVWFTKLLTGDYLVGGLFILSAMVVALLGHVFMQWLYQGAMIAYNEVGSGSQDLQAKYSVAKQSVLWRLTFRHIGIVLHNPTFALQIGLSMFVPILVGGITLLTGEFNLDMLKSKEISPFIPYIYTGILVSPALMGTLSATVITREGKTFWQTLVLPISHHLNLQTRILSGDLMCLAASLVLGIFGLVLLPIEALDALAAAAFAVVLTHTLNAIDLYINVQRPLLNWTHPTAAVKNNLNIMLALLLRGGLGVLFYYGVMQVSLGSFQFKLYIASGGLVLIYLIQQLIFYPRLIKDFKLMEW